MRLIDADALMKTMRENSEGNEGWYGDTCAFMRDVENAPTIDAAPVRHGHWIKITPSGIYECSKCGKNVMTCDIEAYKYCQRCGARMDGDNNAFI